MSVSIVSVIMERIAGARPTSRIAVFDVGSPDKADAVFADTARSLQLIEAKTNLIGVYDGSEDPVQVRHRINAC